MSRAAVCLVVLLLVPTALAVEGQQGPTFSVTLPDGTQIQGTTDLQGGIVTGVSGFGVVPQGGGVNGQIVGPNGQPVRDTRPTTGNSRIRGRVLVADTMQPA